MTFLPLAFRPFLEPLPVYGNLVWPLLLLPLSVAIAVVYKSIKCRTMGEVPRESAEITAWIVLGMAATAGGLALLVKVLERTAG
jgi:hypothetical protein